MANEEIYLNPRIVVSRTVCHEKPRIAGTRIMVCLILDLLAGGKSFDEIITDYYPDITTDDIRACLEYANRQ